MPLPLQRDRRAYYIESDLILRDITDGAVATTTSEIGIEFAVRSLDMAKVAVNYSAIGGTVDASNYWQISVEVSDVVGGTYTAVGTSAILLAAGGITEIPLSGIKNLDADADANFIRVTATETGTTAGDLTYGAFITPMK